MGSNKINLDSIILQNKDHIESDMNGEKVMFSVKNGKYYNLGIVGGDIWELLKEPISINQLISLLMEKYDVQREQCEENVIGFLEHLRCEELISIKSEIKI
jgi:hypothetical protein